VRKIGFIFSFLLTVFSLYGQEIDPAEQVRLSGELFNKETGESIPYVHIINSSTNEGTTSDLDGKFSLPVSTNDTVVFSAVGFEKYYLTWKERPENSNEYFIKISLDPSTLELAPVNIFAFKDEAGFKQDILNMKLPEDNSKIVIPGSYNGPRREATGEFSLSSLLSPASAIYNLFSKDAKELRKYSRVLKEYPRQKAISEKYNMQVVEKITGLKDESLNEFMLFCKMPEDFILQANEYEIILAVNNCYKEFQENRN